MRSTAAAVGRCRWTVEDGGVSGHGREGKFRRGGETVEWCSALYST